MIYRYISKNPIFPPFIKNVNGLPSVLGPKLGLLIDKRDKGAIRMVLTILQVSYILKADVRPDLTPVTKPSTANQIQISLLNDFSKKFAKSIFTGPKLKDWDSLHLSTSAGPNGPAVWGSSLDMEALNQNQIQYLFGLGGPKFQEYFTKIYPHRKLLRRITENISKKTFKILEPMALPEATRDHKLPCTRRLTTVDSPEGKKRVIAIFDYWSQTVLKDVHDWAFAQLRTLKSDMTFNQGGFRKEMTHRISYFSFDLTAATDRFPITVQRNLLEVLIGKEKADSWEKLLIADDFTVSWDRPNKVKYGAGQPMGAYSSWAVFSMSHHLIVQYAASLNGFEPGKFESYCLLGDDLVIADPMVALSYKDIIESLGVQISEQKSLVSFDTFEFAKRLVVNNEEMTPFPLAAVVENAGSISALWSTLFVANDRGFTTCDYYVNPHLAAGLQKACGIKYKQSYKAAKDLQALHSYLHNTGDFVQRWWALAHLEKTLSLDVSCNITSENRFLIVEDILGRCNVEYQSELLNNTMYKYIDLRKTCVYQLDYYTQQCIKQGSGDGSTLPIDLEDIPLVQIMDREVNKCSDEMISMSDLEDVPMLISLQYRVSPALDLSRVISRRINTKASARQLGLLRFFRTKVAEFNQEFTNELKAPSLWREPLRRR